MELSVTESIRDQVIEKVYGEEYAMAQKMMNFTCSATVTTEENPDEKEVDQTFRASSPEEAKGMMKDYCDQVGYDSATITNCVMVPDSDLDARHDLGNGMSFRDKSYSPDV